MLKALVLHGAMSTLICSLFKNEGYEIVHDIQDADVVVFSGGEDIDPFLYDTATHKTTSSNWNRDQREIAVYHQALELGLPCIGICRAAQLLHALNGGELWQDVNKHGGAHMAYTFGTKIPVWVSSLHHQMLMPNNKTENIMLLVANIATCKSTMSKLEPENDPIKSKSYEISRLVSDMYKDDDIEALYYPETNCLCFQPHPELYMPGKSEEYRPMVDLFFGYINQYCLGYTEQQLELPFDKETA